MIFFLTFFVTLQDSLVE